MITGFQIVLTLFIVQLVSFARFAHIPVAGNYDPFIDENSPENAQLSSSNGHNNHDQQTVLVNDTQHEPIGPSLDIIDFHPRHEQQEKKSDNETTKAKVFQPSLDILDAQLHAGVEHIHESNQKNTANEDPPANLDDYQRWLKEQNQTDQLNRFLELQKEVKKFHLDNKNDLNEKLNRTIEELKQFAKEQQERRHDL